MTFIRKKQSFRDSKKQNVLKMIEIRLGSIGEASKRVKIVFIVAMVASCAMLITVYHSFYSFTRQRAFEDTLKFNAVDVRNFSSFHEEVEKSTDPFVIKLKEKFSDYEEKDAKGLKITRQEVAEAVKLRFSKTDQQLKTIPAQEQTNSEDNFKRHQQNLRLKKEILIAPYLEIINTTLDEPGFHKLAGSKSKRLYDLFKEPEKPKACSSHHNYFYITVCRVAAFISAGINAVLDYFVGPEKLYLEDGQTIQDVENIIAENILHDEVSSFYKTGANHLNQAIIDRLFPGQIEWKSSFAAGWPLSLHQQNTRSIANDWIHNQNITISVLGVNVNVDQFSLFGSLTLLIISFWMLFSMRRENRAIITLLRDVREDIHHPKIRYSSDDLKDNKFKDDYWDMANLAYQGIVHNLVFIHTGQSDRPMTKEDIFKNKVSGEDDRGDRNDKPTNIGSVVSSFIRILTILIRGLVYFLFLTPAIATFTILVVDFKTTIDTLSPYSGNPAAVLITRNLNFPDLIQSEVTLGWGVGFVTLICGFACIVFQLQTTWALRYYYEKLTGNPEEPLSIYERLEKWLDAFIPRIPTDDNKEHTDKSGIETEKKISSERDG